MLSCWLVICVCRLHGVSVCNVGFGPLSEVRRELALFSSSGPVTVFRGVCADKAVFEELVALLPGSCPRIIPWAERVDMMSAEELSAYSEGLISHWSGSQVINCCFPYPQCFDMLLNIVSLDE